MSRVIVAADSLCGIPAQLVPDLDVRIIPDILTINGKDYRDNVDISPDEFWKVFPTIKTWATSAPSPGDFVKFFQEAGSQSGKVIFFSVSKQLSAVYKSAISARDSLRATHPGLDLQVIDSRFSAGAMGFIVMEAARAASDGKDMAEVTQAAENMMDKVKSVCSMETLKYLIRSGRAPKKAYIGELLGVKPLVGMVNDSGLTESLGRARGKEQAFRKLVEMIPQYTDASKPLHVIVQYTNSLQDGENLSLMVRDKYDCSEMYLIPYSPISAGHSGPVNSISFYS